MAGGETGAREKLLSLSLQLTAALETPSEAIQRIGWAQVRTSLDRLTFSLNLF